MKPHYLLATLAASAVFATGVTQTPVHAAEAGPVTTQQPVTPPATTDPVTPPTTTDPVTPEPFTPYVGVIDYVPGFAVNLYQGDISQLSFSGRRLNHGSRWQVLGKAQAADGTWYVSLGANQWVNARYVKDQATMPIPVIPLTPFVGTVNYVPGFSINLYEGDLAKKQFNGRKLKHGSQWRVVGYALDATGTKYYNLGGQQWVPAQYISDKPLPKPVAKVGGTATVTYVPGYKIAVWGKPNAQLTSQRLVHGSRWRVIGKQMVGNTPWYQLGQNQWVSGDYVIVTGSQYRGSAHISGVPMIPQRPELPNGCEITAVTMMVQSAGKRVDKMTLAREMPRSSNPNYGYIGQPWDGTGITIFPSALTGLVRRYLGTSINMTGMGLDALYYQLDRNHVVVTWNTLHGFPYHALAVTGYDANYIYYNDCWTNQRTKMNKWQFLNNWNTQQRRAISY